MSAAPEDVYYATRDCAEVIGLNQLLAVPALSEIELGAIDEMCTRSYRTMGGRTTVAPIGAWRANGNVQGLSRGLYYVDPDSNVWLLSQEGVRPDLDGTQMDFARATVEAGRQNLAKLRSEAKRV
jgi:hypothetical protein